VLRGGSGQDTFVFDTKIGGGVVDRILDFNVQDDTIRLDDKIFTNVGGTGALSSSAFQIGAFAQDESDRIIYDTQTGVVFYDSDGNGSTAQIAFATLSVSLGLSSNDFTII
jgi:Ca2+-binding RTX toxin-like protein